MMNTSIANKVTGDSDIPGTLGGVKGSGNSTLNATGSGAINTSDQVSDAPKTDLAGRDPKLNTGSTEVSPMETEGDDGEAKKTLETPEKKGGEKGEKEKVKGDKVLYSTGKGTSKKSPKVSLKKLKIRNTKTRFEYAKNYYIKVPSKKLTAKPALTGRSGLASPAGARPLSKKVNTPGNVTNHANTGLAGFKAVEGSTHSGLVSDHAKPGLAGAVAVEGDAQGIMDSKAGSSHADPTHTGVIAVASPAAEIDQTNQLAASMSSNLSISDTEDIDDNNGVPFQVIGSDGKPRKSRSRGNSKSASKDRRRLHKAREGKDDKGEKVKSTNPSISIGSKRPHPGNESRQNNREPPRKKTFAEVVKEKESMVCTVRANDKDIDLDQSDFDHINYQAALIMLKEPCGDEDEDDEVETVIDNETNSISLGSLRFALGNQKSVDFLKNIIPKIACPEGKDFKYEFYGPGVIPYRYHHTMVPTMFMKTPELIPAIIRKSNPTLRKVTNSVTGEKKESHIRIKKTMVDSRKEATGRDTKILLEMDGELFLPLCKLEGQIKLSLTKIIVRGGGIEQGIMEEKAKASVIIIDDGAKE